MRRGPIELDDGVRERVVAVRRREEDHLEVAGEIADGGRGAPGPRVVEGDERVVEEEGRAPATEDEPHEAEAGGEEDLVERPLAELGGADEVAALRREDTDVERAVVDLDAPVPVP
jgi:hypothetical protein